MSDPTPASIKKQAEARYREQLLKKEQTEKRSSYGKRGSNPSRSRKKGSDSDGVESKKDQRPNRSRTSGTARPTHPYREGSAPTKSERPNKPRENSHRSESLSLMHRPFLENPAFRIYAHGVLSSEESE